jgi:GT2 family glycosyltransferase
LFLKYYRKIIEILKLKSGHRILGPYAYGLKYFGDISDPPKTKMDFTSREFQKIYFGEAVIRGPIIWKSDLFEFFSGFNDISYVLGRDECDLCFRASNNGFIVGYIPSLSYSFKEMGTSRKIRTPDVQNDLIKREKIAKENPGELTLFWKNSRGIKSCKVSKLQNKVAFN